MQAPLLRRLKRSLTGGAKRPAGLVAAAMVLLTLVVLVASFLMPRKIPASSSHPAGATNSSPVPRVAPKPPPAFPR
jgi:hypothetical protein